MAFVGSEEIELYEGVEIEEDEHQPPGIIFTSFFIFFSYDFLHPIHSNRSFIHSHSKSLQKESQVDVPRGVAEFHSTEEAIRESNRKDANQDPSSNEAGVVR